MLCYWNMIDSGMWLNPIFFQELYTSKIQVKTTGRLRIGFSFNRPVNSLLDIYAFQPQ